MSEVQVVIHVRFAPDGSVTEIGERPASLSAQEWFNRLSLDPANAYQSLSGGRGVFRIERGRVELAEIRGPQLNGDIKMTLEAVDAIRDALASGLVIPYLGRGVLALAGEGGPLPDRPEVLVDRLTAKASVPHKIRKNLTAAAQYIENFKHRKTVKSAMTEAFRAEVQPAPLHRYLASLPNLRLIVHAWYDDLPQRALAGRESWGMVQGVSQAEHFGEWVHYFDAPFQLRNATSWHKRHGGANGG